MDFVILWVDNQDPKWRKNFEKYSVLETGEKRDCRYRDWNNLHYWFRGVEKFAPWVDKIFFITANQIPSWMNTNHPKLRLVNHEEYIPKELLPTFCSATIEVFLHRIPDLSEQFVLFNDDFFIINKILPTRFFRKELPVDICALNPCLIKADYFTEARHVALINKHFDKKQVVRKHLFKWFSFRNGKQLIRTYLLYWWPRFVGFHNHHFPQPFLKSIFREIWEKEGDVILESVRPRFRQYDNITQYLFRYWQLASNRFICSNIYSDSINFYPECGFYPRSEKDIEKAAKIINKQRKNIIVINDSINPDFDFESAKAIINQAFENILPEKSSFEK
jgi:hypothetical protein